MTKHSKTSPQHTREEVDAMIEADAKKRDSITLPDWLDHPEPAEVATMSFRDGEGYFLTSPDGTEHHDPAWWGVDAYEAASELAPRTTIVSIGPDLDFSGVFVTSKGERTSRILLSFDADEDLRLLKSTYVSSLGYAEEWRKNPDNFFAAYHYVDTHPAFWIRHTDEPTFSWSTDGHAQRVWTYPMSDKQGDLVWALETGQHALPEGREHYHDLRLDSYGATIEEAFINLAKKVGKFFNDDGTEKNEVEHEKSALEEILSERLEEFEKSGEDFAAKERARARWEGEGGFIPAPPKADWSNAKATEVVNDRW